MSKLLLEVNREELNREMFKEFNKCEKDVEVSVEIIRKWTDTQLHFPEKPSDRLIHSFLRNNKFSVEKAKQRLDMYYSIRNLMPELFSKHPLSSDMIEQSKITYCIPLPKLAKDYKRVLYTKISADYGPEVFIHERFLCHIINVVEVLIQEDAFLGTHFIFDCGGVKMGHISKFSPMVLRKASIIMERVFSNRVSSVHMVNYHPYMESVLNVIKPLFGPKIAARIQVHTDAKDMFHCFSKEILPKDIGGEEHSLSDLNDLWLKKMEANKERFDWLQSMRVDESLRPSKLVNDDILGFYGNFKKIEVD